MHHFIVGILTIFIWASGQLSYAGTGRPNFIDKKALEKVVKKNTILTRVEIDSETVNKQKMQSLYYHGIGLHPKSCSFALRKLSQYENFRHFLDFVKMSEYNDQKKQIELLLDHALLPFPMGLKFIIPRIKKPGRYPFKFERGFLKGLTGFIWVENKKGRCLFAAQSTWRGPHTKIPNLVFDLFSTTLARAAMVKLFRISSMY